MKKKYYAVKVGRNVGIYGNWEDCKKEILGFSGAIYKSFGTFEEAKDYLNFSGENIVANIDLEKNIEDIDIEKIKENEVISYVDGSYKKDTLEYGYGVVLITNLGIKEIFGKGQNPEVASSRNVTGELFGCIKAVSKAISLKKDKITIFYDYQGISSWANGEWKCNIPLTQGYKEKIAEFRKEIEINFVKVKAHSNNKYNDLADHLAKKSLGIEK